MGKKDKSGVGRAVLKDRSKGGKFGKNKQSWLHTSELNDGEDWSRFNGKSVTEESALDEFLATAELAGTEFIAEKLNVTVISSDHRGGLPSKKKEQQIQEIQEQHKQFLQIPRRPPWDKTTTAEQLDLLERESFLSWRRTLAELQAKDNLILTPFERNLEFWRQLWRVIERSDVVVQIVDARNPLLFRCEDLENYISEVSKHKVNVLLINKADFLNQEQRELWASYFRSINVTAVFWSAVFETERLKHLKLLEETERQVSEVNTASEQGNIVPIGEHVTNFLHLDEEVENGVSENDQDKCPAINSNVIIDAVEYDVQSRSLTANGRETKGDELTRDLSHLDPENLTHANLNSFSSSLSPALLDPTNVGRFQNEPSKSNCDEMNLSCSDDLEESHSTRFDPRGCYMGERDLGRSEEDSFPDMNAPRLTENFVRQCADDETKKADDIKEHSLEEFSNVNEKFPRNGGFSEKSMGEDDDDKIQVAGKTLEFYTSGHLLTGEELLAFFQWLHKHHGDHSATGEENYNQQTVIGLVGYPNVGKSSTINAILQAKKVPVSSTPGRTKHFQTLLVDKNICLCDCPGLVFPSFVTCKAEMVVSGILPIDQMRDHVAPVSLVCRRIPRGILETTYGINLVVPQDWEDSNREPYPEELLSAYSYTRGYMTRQGRPDCSRSARYILKDYVNGKILYCHPPPRCDPKTFQASSRCDVKPSKKRPTTDREPGNISPVNKIDREFFRQQNVKFHTSATTGTEQYRKLMQTSSSLQSHQNTALVAGKPWKKHGNRNKKEKLRRLKPSEY